MDLVEYNSETMLVLNVWSEGNKIFSLYRDATTGRKRIVRLKFRPYIYLRTEDIAGDVVAYLKRKRQREEIFGFETDDINDKWTKLFINYESGNLPFCSDEGRINRILLDKNSAYENPALLLASEMYNKFGIDVCEADVDPASRFLIDTDVKRFESPRKLYFDIETDDRRKDIFSTPGEHAIVSFAWIGFNGDEWVNGFECMDCDRLSNHDDSVDFKNKVEASEKQLLLKMKSVLKKFDICYAWNGDNFDYPNVFNRMRAYDIPVPYLHFVPEDLMVLFKKYHKRGGSDLSSFALDTVGSVILGVNKIDRHNKPMHRIFAEDKPFLEEYNMRDVEIMKLLDDKTGYTDVDLAICRISSTNYGVPYISRKVDGLVLSYGKENGRHFPSRKRYAEIYTYGKIAGAFVFDPVPGIYENVAVFDFSSLYPNIMRTWNISPETYVENEEGESVVTVPGKGYKFAKNVDGIFPLMFMHTKERRNYFKKLAENVDPSSFEYRNLDSLQYAYKELGLSLYGELGDKYSRFYSPMVAESITACGQYLIKLTMALAKKEFKYNPIYGDTDSVFLQIPKNEVSVFSSAMNEKYAELANRTGVDEDSCEIDLQFETYFDRILLIAKKRYAGYASFYKGSDNDHIEIKGLEFMRTDVSAVVRKVQHKIVDMILKGVASEEKIVEIILAVKQAVLAGKMRKEDIEIRKVLTKEPKEYKTSTPHSRVATWANQNGIECFVGTKVPFIVVNREKVDESLLASDKKGLCAMHGDVWKEEYGYDIAYYWNKMVFPSLERVLVAAFPKRKWEEFYYQNGIKKRGKK